MRLQSFLILVIAAITMCGCNDSPRRVPIEDADAQPERRQSTNSVRRPRQNRSARIREPKISIPTQSISTNACNPSEPSDRLRVIAAVAPVFVQPKVLQVPLTTLDTGVILSVTERIGDWYLILFDDPRWGRRVGYVHCSNLASEKIRTRAQLSPPPTAIPPEQTPEHVSAPETVTPSIETRQPKDSVPEGYSTP